MACIHACKRVWISGGAGPLLPLIGLTVCAPSLLQAECNRVAGRVRRGGARSERVAVLLRSGKGRGTNVFSRQRR